MTSQQPLILYDLPTRPRPHVHAWSANAWKTRLVLNYKQIPYTTSFIPIHALQSTLAQTNVSPHPKPNWTDYTVPTIRFEDGSHMSDSAKLAVKLEELYPEPSLKLNPELEKEATDALMKAVIPFIPAYFMPRLWRDVIAEEDMEWFRADRTRRFGVSLEEMDEAGALEKAQPGLDGMAELLRRNGGPFLLGKDVCYADFIMVAGLHCFMVIGEGEYERVVAPRKELKELYEACGEWLKKDD